MRPAIQLKLMMLAAALLTVLATGCGCGPAAPAKAVGSPAAAQRLASAAGPDTGLEITNAPAAVPIAEFHADLRSGRDPFFPNSARFVSRAVDATRAPELPLSSYLKLVGIWHGTTRPMALINRTSLAPGEEADVSVVIPDQFNRPEIQRIRIRCLEIRQDSVLVSVAGEQDAKELQIANGK